jgi:hypothetical protein
MSYLQFLGLVPKTRNPLRLLCFGAPICALGLDMKSFVLLAVTEQEEKKKPIFSGTRDSVIADLNGNLVTEIFIARELRHNCHSPEKQKYIEGKA